MHERYFRKGTSSFLHEELFPHLDADGNPISADTLRKMRNRLRLFRALVIFNRVLIIASIFGAGMLVGAYLAPSAQSIQNFHAAEASGWKNPR